jgi:hypothetical protein
MNGEKDADVVPALEDRKSFFFMPCTNAYPLGGYEGYRPVTRWVTVLAMKSKPYLACLPLFAIACHACSSDVN